MKPYCVTVIGAESTGKTTLSRQLADTLAGDWVCEFARPYLEVTSKSITAPTMRAIWQGQKALQHSARQSPRQVIVQDTDLFATVGYWQLPHIGPAIGACPAKLTRDAEQFASNLYLITTSNIPFEADPLRYGGTVRESADTYWIALCQRHKLPYVVIRSSSQKERLHEALRIITERRNP